MPARFRYAGGLSLSAKHKRGKRIVPEQMTELDKTAYLPYPTGMRYYSVEKAAELSGFHPNTIRRWADDGTMFIPKSAMNPTRGPYHTMLGEMSFSEVVPPPQGDCRLTYRSGRWFVTVPVETATKTAESQGRVVSIDPGVRTFATFYSPDCCGKIGTGDFSRIQRLCHHLDELLSRTGKEKNRNRRYRMKKAQARMRWKIKDLIDELHRKAALFFVRNFDVILR